MTPTETSRVIHAGNGVTTAFSTGFYFLAASELQVILKASGGSDVLQTLGVHYTVTTPTPGSGAAGTVTMLAAPGVGDTLTIQRTVPFTQNVALRSQGSFSPATHENIADELTFQTQQLDRRVSDIEAGGLTGTFTAGNGLSVAAGPTLNVGAGAGIQSNADTVEVLYGASGAIANVTRAAAGAGVANTAARSDHKHDISTAAPAALGVGNAQAEGSATSVARSDHQHEVPVAAPVQLDTTAPQTGASGNFSDADHKHEIRSGDGAELTDSTNTPGTGPGFTPEGHSHSHGARAGGTLHATATSATAGFQSAADKAISETVTEHTLTTTDATVTTIASFAPTNTKAETVIATVTAKDKATGDSASYRVVACAKRQAGTTTLTGAATAIWTIEDVAGWACTIDVSTPDVRVRVTGAAATNIDWKCRLERVKSP